MKKYTIILAMASLATAAHAETFTVDTGHAEIGFSARHMMVSNTKGKPNRRDLGIDHAPAAVIGDEVKISIEVEAGTN